MRSHRHFVLPGLLALAASAAVPPAVAAQRATPRLAAAPAPPQLRTLEFTAAAIAWLDDSTLALIDSDEKQIVAVSRNGAMRRIGREGSGPGEFRFPALLLAGNGSLLVADIGARRVSRFDAQLRFVGSTPTPGPALQLLSLEGDRLRLAWLDFASPAGGPVVGELAVSSGRATRGFAVFDRDSALGVRTSTMQGPTPFVAVAGGAGGAVFAASPQTYRITAFDSAGRRLRSFGRELAPAYRTEAEVEAIVSRNGTNLRRMAGAEGATGDPMDELRRTLRKQPKPHFSMTGVTADARGRLWIATSRGDARTEVDIFGRDGAFLGTVSLAGRVSALAVRLPWVAALAERTSGEDEGLQGVDLYRIGGE